MSMLQYPAKSLKPGIHSQLNKDICRNSFTSSRIDQSLSSRIYGLSYRSNSNIQLDELRYLTVLYIGFDKKKHIGELICNHMIAEALLNIFYKLYINFYQIEKIKLIDDYHANDTISCLDNNSSCFNYRNIEGTDTLSQHAYGLAVDINPVYNPYITATDGVIHVSPVGSERFVDCKFTSDNKIHCTIKNGVQHHITENDLCYRLFTSYGFIWGGHWSNPIDYQHFELR